MWYWEINEYEIERHVAQISKFPLAIVAKCCNLDVFGSHG